MTKKADIIFRFYNGLFFIKFVITIYLKYDSI